MLAKAAETDVLGRFREIVADPLNLLIRRVPDAGGIVDDCVILHNGHRVALSGPLSYYGDFSRILVINRGVHEPLEEYVFQELLASGALPEAPVMLELGAYWGHYSMWMKQKRPRAAVHLLEPEEENLRAGVENFRRNGYEGTFAQAYIGRDNASVAGYLRQLSLPKLHVLHSDVQGYEVEMLEGCEDLLERKAVDYLCISTHSQALHEEVALQLQAAGYRVEVSSDVDLQTTAHDGFIFASSPDVPEILPGFTPPERARIPTETPAQLVQGLVETLDSRR